jgi:hypothetical protein
MRMRLSLSPPTNRLPLGPFFEATLDVIRSDDRSDTAAAETFGRSLTLRSSGPGTRVRSPRSLSAERVEGHRETGRRASR